MMTQIQPKLVIHGGAGSSLQSKGGITIVRQLLHKIVEEVYTMLLAGSSAKSSVVRGCKLLEDEPYFNAGNGSVLQSDGQIRMSASLMDGCNQSFSGIINVSRVKNPIDLALFLQDASDRVLSDYGAAELVRDLQIPSCDVMTDIRLQEWIQGRQGKFKKTMAGVIAESKLIETSAPGQGTVGVVALDTCGKIAAGTSTGGKGFERIGRVSDSAMPAGNYATSDAGASCTGIGEDIIDECLAPRIVIRVSDGMSLRRAMEKSLIEAGENKRDLGVIALSTEGSIAWGKTSNVLLAAFHNGNKIGDTLELKPGMQIGCI